MRIMCPVCKGNYPIHCSSRACFVVFKLQQLHTRCVLPVEREKEKTTEMKSYMSTENVNLKFEISFCRIQRYSLYNCIRKAGSADSQVRGETSHQHLKDAHSDYNAYSTMLQLAAEYGSCEEAILTPIPVVP